MGDLPLWWRYSEASVCAPAAQKPQARKGERGDLLLLEVLRESRERLGLACLLRGLGFRVWGFVFGVKGLWLRL